MQGVGVGITEGEQEGGQRVLDRRTVSAVTLNQERTVGVTKRRSAAWPHVRVGGGAGDSGVRWSRAEGARKAMNKSLDFILATEDKSKI